MSDAEQISGLESALAERARKLAEEHLANGRLERERLLAETRQRLDIEKERKVLAAKAHAEHAYRQRVQAAELELRAALDRVRQELSDAALAQLPAQLSACADDEAHYLPLLQNYLREAAQAIERDELVARFNARDLQRLQADWAHHAGAAAPGKRLSLSPDPLACLGGVLVASGDGDIRFDNTFEGRMERREETLRSTVAERLMPQEITHE
ncbi:MAG TPA: V-type ATP synthase subunit E family protein [Gallionella sp.]|nr:V-type ATP synthase subunit E family protein [Gallionella sp.]